MKKSVLLAIIMGLFFACEVMAQAPSDTLWTRNYGGPGAEVGSCVQRTRRVRDIMRIDGREIPIQVSKGECVPEKQLTLIRNVIKNDFLINDDLTGGCFQGFPSIAMAGSGNFVVVWEDARKGERDIYAQRYDAEGTPQGSNFVVSDVGAPAYRQNPSVAMDGSGNFVVVWEDTRNGFGNYDHDFDIYAQRYDAEGNPQGSNFRVNDDMGSDWQSSPAVAMNGSGSFIVAWEDSRNDWGYDIYAQRYDASGTPQDSNFIVNDNIPGPPPPCRHEYPTVAIDDIGNFVIVWQDGRNGYNNPDIYAQRYDAIGTPQDSNFIVNDDTGTDFQSRPSIVMNNNGDFIVAWTDGRNGYNNPDIYAQRYDASGTPQGSNFIVNDDTGTNLQYYSSIGMDDNGCFVVAWNDTRNGNYDIYAQGYDASGTPQGSNFMVNDDTGTNFQYYPSIGMDDNGGFFVAWIDERNGDVNEDIYIQRYLTIGIALGLNFMVNDDVGSSFQRFPSVAMDNIGNFVVAWNDERNGNYDIYAQMYDASGNPQGSNFMVNDVGEGFQRVPSVAMDGTGNFIVTWDDDRNGNTDIYAQRYDVYGNPLGLNFRVDDDASSSYQGWPSVAMNGAGNFIIAWDDKRNGNNDIYAQMYDASGNPQGSNFLVNDDTISEWQFKSSIAVDAEGSFVIAWDDFRNFWDFIADIYAQRYDENGVPQGSNFRVNDDIGPYDQYETSIAMDNIGNFVIAWQDFRNGDNPDIYAQKYDEYGIPQDSNFRVNDDVGSHIHWWPSVTMAPLGDRFVIAWTDYRNPDGNPDIVAQKYENGIPVNANLQINEPDSLSYDKQWSWGFCTACNNDIIAFTWMDTRRHKGWDIYGKITDWELITRTDEDNLSIPIVYSLSQNYPNPFNTKTTIQFSTEGSDKNTLITIYNFNGQKIKTLVDKKLEPGTHQVVWDGTDDSGNAVPAGVYFYKMECGDKYTGLKKMILMK